MLLQSIAWLGLVGQVLSSEKVRGVPPSKLSAYQSADGHFQCLDGSKRIPYGRVNDDYCDCEDGSDEPGTSACPNTTFFCQNAGHIPVYLPSNRVNDGVCEEACCDGSDEWNGLVTCPNTCRQKAKEHAAIEAAKEATRASGWKVKEEWQRTAHRLRSEIQDELQRRQAQLQAFSINLHDKEAALAKLQSESQDSAKSFAEAQEELDSILIRYHRAINNLRAQVTEQQRRIGEYETILRDLAQGYNPNFQDMSVKGAVTSFNELKGLVEQGMSDQVLEELTSLTFELPKVSAAPVPSNDSPLWNTWQKSRAKLADMGLLQRESISPAAPGEVVENKQITNLKTSVDKLRDEVLNAERDIQSLQSSLDENFGPNDVYRAVKGQCFSALISDYTYEVCLLDTLHQKSSNTNTLVGKFDHVDENGSLHYTHGQRCWNGPERSGRVDVECGAQHELLSVREAQKCEYVFRVKSPLACGPPANQAQKDEL